MKSSAQYPMVLVASLMRRRGATGVQTHMREFEAHLKSVGHPHKVVTPFFILALPLLLPMIGLRRVLEVVWPPAAVWLYRAGHGALMAVQLWWWLRRNPHSVVYAQCPVSAALALKMVRRPAQQVVLIIHFNLSQADEWVDKGMISRGGRLEHQIQTLERETLDRVDRLVFVSQFVRSQLMGKLPDIARVPAALIPNFVKPLQGAPLSNMAGRDLIAIGTLEPRKNQAYLLEVLAHAKAQGMTISLTLVGDGADRDALVNKARALGVCEQIDFVGFHPQARTLIPGHKLCVHAAWMENLPMALIESLSAGVPVVAARVGGIPEIYDDGQEGRFWPLDDPKAGAEVLMSILKDPATLARMSKQAHQRYVRAFASQVVAGRLLEFLIHREG